MTTRWIWRSPPQRAPVKRKSRLNYFELLLVIIRIRRMLGDHHRIFLQRLQRDLNSSFELPVVPGRNRRRIVFHFDIRRDSAVLHFPLTVQTVDGHTRRRNVTAVQQRRETTNFHPPAPSAPSHQRAPPVLL